MSLVDTVETIGTREHPLRVLHLEDNAADRELVQRALADAGLNCEFVHAGSRQEFVAALADRTFDLILSDFSIPGYDGATALELAQEKCPAVPYLFVSGTIGEERAIESLKSGATDYVLKGHLDRLLPAVRRALRESGERAKRKSAEEALRQAEARFRSIFENAVEGIYQSTPAGRLIDANRAMARLCGYDSPEELLTSVRTVDCELYVDPGRRTEFVRRLDAQGEVLGYEAQVRRKDGATIWISENARTVRGSHGEPLYYESMVADITARRRAEEALRESEERFREMAGRVDDVFWIAAPDGLDWLYVSPAYERIWGRALAELHAQPEQWMNAVAEDDRAALRRARARLADGREFRIEYRVTRPDGTMRWVDERGYPVRAADGTIKRTVGVAMDITQRKQLESHLAQAQKMEALGQLAGGVAHDFNNVLTVILGYSRLLLDTGGLSPEITEPLTQIYTAGTRASNLTRQLLVFSRKQPTDRRVIDLNQVVTDVVKMLERLIGEHIALKIAPAAQPVTVEADLGMMEQVIMNLAVNARDAMGPGGTLTIGTERIAIDEAQSRRHPAARPGEFACISVRDTGCGIPPENLGRIFEPFYTTKGTTHGTGLGLATVFGIVQQHQGWVEVDSMLGVGTCFRVLLPAAASTEVPAIRRNVKTPPVNGGTETVLLVEDEATVREFAVAVLRGHGYRVLQASSGVEALETWKWHGERIALLFTDLVLPDGLSGIELLAKLRKDKPTLRLVLTSGYPSETGEPAFTPPPGTHFITKPYRPQVLAQTVRDALDGVFHS